MKYLYRFLCHLPTLTHVSSWKLESSLLSSVFVLHNPWEVWKELLLYLHLKLPAPVVQEAVHGQAGVPTEANCLVEQVIICYLIRQAHYFTQIVEVLNKLPSVESTEKHAVLLSVCEGTGVCHQLPG